jgi:predicted nucleic acid-binding protein
MTAHDTNVLIYACDRSDPLRQRQAIDVIRASPDGVLLWQVACEFVAASRKLSRQGFAAADAWGRLGEFLDLFPLVLPTAGVLKKAHALTRDHGISFWDAMILGACLEAGVDTFYSEDEPGLKNISGLTIINPFR